MVTKIELVPDNAGVAPAFPEAEWFENTLRYAVEGGWPPELDVPRDLGRGMMPWLVYRPTVHLTSADVGAMADGLAHWFDMLSVRYHTQRDTNHEFVTRDAFIPWLRQAGGVLIGHNPPWRPDRLTGTRAVVLSGAFGEKLELTPAEYHAALELAEGQGWQYSRCFNDRFAPGDPFRPDGYDLDGAVIVTEDATALVAALRTAPVLAAGLPMEMIPVTSRPAARLIELVQRGDRRGGSGWVRVGVDRAVC